MFENVLYNRNKVLSYTINNLQLVLAQLYVKNDVIITRKALQNYLLPISNKLMHPFKICLLIWYSNIVSSFVSVYIVSNMRSMQPSSRMWFLNFLCPFTILLINYWKHRWFQKFSSPFYRVGINFIFMKYFHIWVSMFVQFRNTLYAYLK